MVDKISITSIGRGIGKSSWIPLKITPETALIFKPEVHGGGVRGWLVRLRKQRGESWEELKEKDFRKINLYDGVKIELGTEQTKLLCEAIERLKPISERGVEYGEKEYVFGSEDEVIVITDKNIRKAIQQILDKGYTEDFWNSLIELQPDFASELSKQLITKRRIKALSAFESNIDSQQTESFWQDFFEENKWIFGYGLNYRILRQTQSQAYYGGTTYNRTGGQQGDYLTATSGDISFTVLVEIKKPDTPLFSGVKTQRSGTWSLSKDLLDGITQLQTNKSTWEIEGSKKSDSYDNLESNNIYTASPKGILVIGRLKGLERNRAKRDTLERFRQSIHGIEVLTFDELLRRAKFIVEEQT